MSTTALPTPPHRPTPASLEYQLFDPAPYAFRPPLVPLLAPLQSPMLRWLPAKAGLAPAWASHGRLYHRARYALMDAFRLSGVGPGGALLAPAFHCRTMLDPALALDAPVCLFALQADLTANLADVERQLRDARVPVKAVLMAHYFGRSQDLASLAALCRQWGATLIEDCAHALPLQSPAGGMGRQGRWCVASPYKFFACADGGALWAGGGEPLPLLPDLQPPAWRTQLRLLQGLRARSQYPARPESRGIDTSVSPAQSAALACARQLAGPSTDFDVQRARHACAPLSRWIIGHSDIPALLQRRRENFTTWVQALQGLAGITLPWSQLGPHDTPYVFPVVVDQPAHRFAALKRAGLPIWRWDSLAASACATSAAYRLSLLQLPCHQALTPAQMRWMIDTLRAVLATPLPTTGL